MLSINLTTRTALSVADVHLTYQLHPVLNGVSFILNVADHLGLVGPNGVGKSTLLRIAAGQLAPDSGSIFVAPGMRLGYLPQTALSAPGVTLADQIAGALAHVHALEARMHALEAEMAQAAGEALTDILDTYAVTADAFERAGGYDAERAVDVIFTGLGIAHLERERPVESFSGGERARAGLALLLLSAPDILLLDEPTNHLDQAALTWLEDWLAAYRGAQIIVSHDRAFLNRTATAILEIDEHTRRARRYAGGYDAYRDARIAERARWWDDWEAQQEEIRHLTLELKEGAHRNSNYRAHSDGDKMQRKKKIETHAGTVSARVGRARERLARIEANPIPQPPEPLRFKTGLHADAFKGRLPIVVSDVRKQFGDRVVLDGVSLTVGAASRIALVGPNGSGKSTLLKLILGQLAADAGEISVSAAARIGYLAQDRRTFDPALTLFEAFRADLDETDQAAKALLIRSGLFRYADFDTRVRDLSAGMERKLQLARIIATRANVLLLDEPTNDLSFDVIEGLETALEDYEGAIVAAAHDRRFLDVFVNRLGGTILELRAGRLIHAGLPA